MKIKTRKLSAIVPHKENFERNTLQLGYYLPNGNWVGVQNIYRSKGGWESDTYIGWYKTITMWKKQTLLASGKK